MVPGVPRASSGVLLAFYCINSVRLNHPLEPPVRDGYTRTSYHVDPLKMQGLHLCTRPPLGVALGVHPGPRWSRATGHSGSRRESA